MGHTQPGDIRPIRIEPDTGWAWRGDERLDLTPKAFAVLRYLVEHPQHLITKDDLLDAVWGDTVVSEAAITSCIRDLRRALDDSSSRSAGRDGRPPRDTGGKARNRFVLPRLWYMLLAARRRLAALTKRPRSSRRRASVGAVGALDAAPALPAVAPAGFTRGGMAGPPRVPGRAGISGRGSLSRSRPPGRPRRRARRSRSGRRGAAAPRRGS